MNISTPRWRDGLLLGQLLGLALLAISYLRVTVNAAELTGQVFDALLAGPVWGTPLGDNIVRFGLGVLLIHCLFGLCCWVLGHLSARAWPSSKATLNQHILLWFIAITVGLLANNAAMFVASSLGQPYAALMSRGVIGLRLGQVIWFAVLAGAAVTVIVAAVRWWQAGGRLRRKGYAALAVTAVAVTGISAPSMLPKAASAPAAKPNVILIGLDSMRADLLDERISPRASPNIAAFMKSGVHFSNATTPLARTFPSMVTMLTGRQPHRTGAVINLLPRELVDDSESLPRILARAGYKTAYATDETRFSNIDGSFGFSQVIMPPIGVSDFMISKLADAPLNNLLVNTRLASWLFPYLHANRGAANTYDPDTFVGRLDRELSADQPLFLTVHLTLAHWPYHFKGKPYEPKIEGEKLPRWPQYYLHTIKRVDQQFADVLATLKKKRLLENAIVVVYSDHGESFDSPNEALVPDHDPLIEALHADPTWGHGTTVLTAHQFRIVLGVRRFGGDQWPAGREVAAPVSFEDVAPTIVEALGAETSAKFDGRSLLKLVQGHEGAEKGFEGRIRFTESEYNPPGIVSIDQSVSPSKLLAALSVYRVNRETDRLEIKPARLDDLRANRQYAALGKERVVAALPKKGGGYDYLALSLAGGVPQRLEDQPPADQPELRTLWAALHSEFGDTLQSKWKTQHVTVDGVANPQQIVTPNVTN
jgi:hypothetical protein